MDKTIKWLLEGDVSVQYLVHKLILKDEHLTQELFQKRMTKEGFVARLLSCQREDGHWGLHYYQPKWTSTHYTLLDLKNFGAPQSLESCQEMVTRMLGECINVDGGMNLSKHNHSSDTCVDGMVLNYSSYFCPNDPRLITLAEHLLSAQKADGGFTWNLHSDKGDPHTTICVLEGLGQFVASVTTERLLNIEEARNKAIEYLLSNGLFLNDPDRRFRKLSYPYRYRYDLLRALEYFASQNIRYDIRMQPAIDWLQEKKSDGHWYLENQHKGNVHFEIEKNGKPSRFITLKALFILNYFKTEQKTLSLN